MKRSVEWVAKAVDGRLVVDGEQQAGAQVPRALDLSLTQTDSRMCEPGSIYVARRGEQTDGHIFVDSAVEKGAAAVIVEREQESLPVPQIVVVDSTIALGQLAKHHLAELKQKTGIQVIGITGSAGKTTTKDLLAQVLEGQGETVASRLSFNNEVGCPLTVLEAGENTRYLVLEMGASGPGHLEYLTQLAPLDVAVVLLVGQAHLEGFGTIAGLVAAKEELVASLAPSSTAILNYDDQAVRDMHTNAGRIIYFSALNEPEAQVTASDVEVGVAGYPSFVAHVEGEEVPVSLNVVGRHQVANALAVFAVGQALGLDSSLVASRLNESWPISPQRMAISKEQLPYGTYTLVDDSYNANPDSMRAAIEAVTNLAPAPDSLVLVLGEMLELGETSSSLHRQVGQVMAEAQPRLIILLGRGADAYFPGAVAHGADDVAGKDPQILGAADAEDAYHLLMSKLRAQDIVLVKGSNASGAWQVAQKLASQSPKGVAE